MPWTWVAEDFNRSDRLLDGDSVGASSLEWQHWNSTASAANAPRIVSNVPTTAGTNYGVQWLVTDVAPLAAGAPILGVGIEVQFTGLGSTDTPPYNYGELWVLPPGLTGTTVYAQCWGPGQRSEIYTQAITGSAVPEYGPSVGMISAGTNKVTRTASLGARTTRVPNRTPWAVGDTVKMQCTYAGNTEVFYNGVGIMGFATPASINGHTLVSGHPFRSYWTHDNWRVGVLT